MHGRASRDADWTVAGLLAWTAEYFTRQALDAPRLSAEILLAHALRCDRIELYTRHDARPSPAQREAFRETVRQAATGRPIAYLIGYKEFFSLRFEVTPDVLIPRPETELLVERTIHLVRAAPNEIRRILDVGAGSGCIAISLARHLPDVTICANDVSAAALEVAKRNARRHDVHERIEFRLGDLLEPWIDGPPFDVIVSNPPYVATGDAASLAANVRDYEPHAALFAGDDGLSILRRLATQTPQHLTPAGHLLLEVAYDQAIAVRGLLDECGWTAIVAYKDLAQHERVVHARRSAAGSTQVA